MAKKASPITSRDRLAYIDYDGEAINPGKNYREYRTANKAKKKEYINPCKHRKVAVTMRCSSGCHEVRVYFVKGMVKLKGSLNG